MTRKDPSGKLHMNHFQTLKWTASTFTFEFNMMYIIIVILLFPQQIQFPEAAGPCGPQVDVLTPILHPNMDHGLRGTGGNVCLSLLTPAQWRPHFGLDEVVQALLYLLHSPNLDDPYSPLFWDCGSVDYPLFEAEVREFLLGRKVRGVQFPRNYLQGKNTDEKVDFDGPESLIDRNLYFRDIKRGDLSDDPVSEGHKENGSEDLASGNTLSAGEVCRLAQTVTTMAVRSATEELTEGWQLPPDNREQTEPMVRSHRYHQVVSDIRQGHCEVSPRSKTYSEGTQVYLTCSFTAPDYDFILLSLTRLCWRFVQTFLCNELNTQTDLQAQT